MTTNFNKTLTELEKADWGQPNHDSDLVKTCHQLRNKPLKDFTIEDLRIMIGQNFSLEFLIPLAIKRLTENILAEGNFYEGDLLKNVLDSDRTFWTKHRFYYQEVKKLYSDNRHIFEADNAHKQIRNSYDDFQKTHFDS